MQFAFSSFVTILTIDSTFGNFLRGFAVSCLVVKSEVPLRLSTYADDEQHQLMFHDFTRSRGLANFQGSLQTDSISTYEPSL